MLRLYFILLVFTSSMGSIAPLCAQYTWTALDDFPEKGRDDGVAFVAGTNIFFGTGRDAGFAFRNDFFEFDPFGSGWKSTSFELPSLERQYASIFTIDNLSYVVGGELIGGFFTNENWRYNVSKNTWKRCAPVPADSRQSAVAFSIAGYGFYGLGRQDSIYYNDFWRYDPVKDEWKQCADFPGGARYESVGASVFSTGYVGLGFTAPNQLHQDMWRYHPLSDTWEQMENFPGKARFYAEAFSLQDELIVGGGYDGANFMSDFYVYSPERNDWERIVDLPIPLRGYSPVRYFDRALLICGLSTGNSKRKEVWELTKGTDSGGKQFEIVSVFPNPSQDKLLINYQNAAPLFMDRYSNPVIEVMNVFGHVVERLTLDQNKGQYTLDITEYRAGLYFLRTPAEVVRFVKI